MCSHRSLPLNNGLLETTLQKPHFVCADVVVCQPPIPHILINFSIDSDFYPVYITVPSQLHILTFLIFPALIFHASTKGDRKDYYFVPIFSASCF